MKIEKKRYYGSTCHIVSINSDEIRLEDTPGIPGKREHILRIFGNPRLDEVTWLRVNRSYFNPQDPKSESLGDVVGDGFTNAAMKSGRLYFEPYIPDNPEWNVGTSYMLLSNGKYSYDNEQYFKDITGKNPRTFFGQSADGTVKFIAADGRRWPWERGLTSDEQRAVAMSEGLINAANLDGGGSSVIVVGDDIINKSYDGRGLGNIFVGYRKYTLDELPVVSDTRYKKGVYVHLLQRLLNHHGANLVTDGIWGHNTRAAVMEYQRKNKLAVDGIVGPQTWRALIKNIAESKPVYDDNLLIIDAGHGGDDPGAVAFGYQEKDIVLVIAKRVRELLKEFKPAMTRTKDITLSHDERSALVRSKYKYCLSIHLNAAGGIGSGIETIHSIYSQKGKELAQYTADELKKNISLPVRRVFSRQSSKGGDYYFMHSRTGSTTTVIVESLFLDNENDIQHLNVELISQAIAAGFRRYLKNNY